MQRQVCIDKFPSLCSSVKALRPGDIVVFDRNPFRYHGVGGKITVKQQGLLNEPGGHRDAEHAGFIVSIEGKLKLAHLMGTGFVLENLDARYFKRTTNVYRPRKFQQQLSEQLTKLVGERIAHEKHDEHFIAIGDDDINADLYSRGDDFANNNNNAPSREYLLKKRFEEIKKKFKLNWSIGVAIRSFIHRLVSSLRIINKDWDSHTVQDTKSLPHDVITKDSICSKYVADSYITACYRLSKMDADNYDYRRYLMNISSFTTPKTLQAYLYRNTNYDMLVMPHAKEEVYNRLSLKIQEEIDRLALEDKVTSQNKSSQLKACLEAFQPEEYKDQVQASIVLLKTIMPILRINTGSGAATPKSYKNIVKFAKSQGIYQEYFLRDAIYPAAKNVKNLAKEHYHYTSTQAKLFSRFRKLGYSDQEARFESKPHPSFGDWFKLSKVRNALLTASVVGFFVWVLPRGLSRVKQVSDRNARLENDATLRHSM